MRPTWARIQAKLGLNIPTLLLMLKGAIAPTIGLAIYQSNGVATEFSTIGYLVPIMSILTIPVVPRARFFQNLIVTMLVVGFAVAISFLSMWCAVKARENTTHISNEATHAGPVAGTRVAPFNAAASVNMAVWLSFEVWLANTFRAFRPQYFLPSIVFSIFVQVTATYGTQFTTMKEAASLVKHLVETFFAGFGLSAAVNVLIVPFTSRKLVSVRLMENLHAVQKTLDAQRRFVDSLSSRDWFYPGRSSTSPPQQRKTPWAEADALQSATMDLAEGLGKMESELRYAKREAGWDYLGPRELAELAHLLKRIFASVLWMESIAKITKRLEEYGGWEAFSGLLTSRTTGELESNGLEKQQWYCLLRKRRNLMERLLQVMKEGIDHSVYTLRLRKPPATAKLDLESNRHNAADNLKDIIDSFVQQRQAPLEAWLTWEGMDRPSHIESLKSSMKPPESEQRERQQFQLHLFLDLEYSLITTARSILDLVKYADSKSADGTTTKKRLIIPSRKHLVKWFRAALSREDRELDYQNYGRRSGTVRVHLDDVLQSSTDPEHLLPQTTWERISDRFRAPLHFFGSPESMFGLRVAVATMSVTLVAFLRNSQHFYIQQRLIWGSIMIAISMTATVGSAMYGQSMRVLGTVVGVVISYVDWYIVDRQPAGVVVFVGISMLIFHYPLIRFSTDPVAPIVAMVTVMLVVGYALQVKKVGIQLAEASGQEYHALYLLSPYRLVTVVGGIGVAFIFTYFPSASTVRRWLRRDLALSVYLLAHYYSSIYTAASLPVRDLAPDHSNTKSLGRVLEKARARLLAKEIVLLQGMKQHISFIPWEPALGGKFPKDIYERLTENVRNILQVSAVLVFITETFQETSTNATDPASSLWLKSFKSLTTSLDSRSHEVASFLATVSRGIETAHPLPLYLKAPRLHLPSRLLADLDGRPLDVEHAVDPGYSAIAALEVTMTVLADDLARLLSETKKLVGVLNPLRSILYEEDLPADFDLIMAPERD